MPGRVPYLHLEGHLPNFYQQGSKLNANGHLMIFLELVVTHPVHEARLSNRTVADYNQLKQEIVLGNRPRPLRRDNLVR